MMKVSEKTFLIIVSLLICLWIIFSGRNYKNRNDYKIGSLIFKTNSLDWGITELNKIYRRSVRVNNPTKEDIFLRICYAPNEIEVKKGGIQGSDGKTPGFRIKARSYDTLLFIFAPIDTSLIGSYSEEIYFEQNSEEVFNHLPVKANIVENFFPNKNLHDNLPKIEVSKTIFNFKEMLLHDSICISFPIKNTGKQNLIIRKIETTCGCTEAITYKRIISPGDSTNLEIVFRSLNSSGYQNKTIKLYCNDPHQPIINFKIKGNVLK